MPTSKYDIFRVLDKRVIVKKGGSSLGEIFRGKKSSFVRSQMNFDLKLV